MKGEMEIGAQWMPQHKELGVNQGEIESTSPALLSAFLVLTFYCNTREQQLINTLSMTVLVYIIASHSNLSSDMRNLSLLNPSLSGSHSIFLTVLIFNCFRLLF